MQLNLVLACVVVVVVHVIGGCVEDPYKIHGYVGDKETSDLKDVELISKDLKFKLDHGLNEKELMEKTLKAFRDHLFSDYQAAEKGLEGVHLTVKESKDEEKNDFLMKALHGILGPDLKKDDISEEDLNAVLLFLKSLSAWKDEDSILKKDEVEHHKELPPGKLDEDLLKIHGHTAEEDAKISEEKFKDFETHLAESVLRTLTDKDAETYLYRDKEALDILKKLNEDKASHVDEAVPYFLMSDEAKVFSKGISESRKHDQEETQLKLDGEEALNKLFSLLKDVIHQDGAIQMDKKVNSMKDSHVSEVMPKVYGSPKTERAVSDMKALTGHKAHHQEGVISHEKDLIFDELLKKEEVHKLEEDDEILHEYGKAFDDEKTKSSSDHFVKSLVSSGEEGVLKASGFEKAKKDAVKAEEDKSLEDILKEDGYYITRGTHAYEKARDQAHEDAKVIPKEEAKKKISVAGEDHVYNHKFLNGEEDLKKVVHHGIDEKALSDTDKYLYDTKSTFEGTLKLDAVAGKEKSTHDASIALGEDSHKAWKDIEFAKDEEKAIYDSGLGFSEEHFKHGIRTDEDHLLHGVVHSTAEDHHLVGTEVVDKDKSHGTAHSLKNKFLSTLRRILNLRKCHLVTMRPGELLGIVDCISRSKDPMLCEKFAMCEKRRPVQVILASEKCQMETIPGEAKRCTAYEPLYPSRDIPLKIFKCVVKNTHELSPVEKKQMMEFEECARQLKAESCGRVPWG